MSLQKCTVLNVSLEYGLTDWFWWCGAATRLKCHILDGLVPHRNPSLLQNGATVWTARGQSSGVSFEGLLFHIAEGVATDLTMQALKLINYLDTWQIQFQVLPQDRTLPSGRSNRQTCNYSFNSSAAIIFRISGNKFNFPIIRSLL